MKKILLFISCVFFLGKINAQQETTFAQYHLNHSLINPAAVGKSNFHTVFTNMRFQWTGLPNSPKTGLVSYQAPFKKIGLGVTVFSDRIASLNRFGANLSYAYRLKMGDDYNLSIAMSGNYQRFFLNKDAVLGIEDQNDLLVYDAMEGMGSYDATLGIYFYSHKMYAGFSIPNAIQTRLNTIGTNLSTVSQLTRQYIFITGYKFTPEKSLFSVEPSMLLRKIENQAFQALLTMKIGMMDEKIFSAFTYGTSDIVTVTAGFKVMSEGKIAYSFDYSLGELYRYTRGSHEISFIWEFGKPNMKKAIPSKRFKG